MQITDDDRIRITERLAPLAAMFPNWKPERATIEAYVIVLADLDQDLLDAAIVEMLGRDLDFMPTAGKVRQAAFDLGSDGLPIAGEAWETVLDDVRNGAGHPVLQTPPKSHPLAQKAARQVGGWRYLALSENPIADRARFLQIYQDLMQQERHTQRRIPVVRQLIANQQTRALTVDDNSETAS